MSRPRGRPRKFDDLKSITVLFKCDKSFFEKYIASDTAKMSEIVRTRIVASENLKNTLLNLLNVFLKLVKARSFKVLNEEDFKVVREAKESCQ